MGVISFLRSRFGKLRTQAKKSPQSQRLLVEELETRLVPSKTRVVLDFGTAGSPAQRGFTRIFDPYFNAARGNGFARTSRAVALLDRGPSNPLTRDFLAATDQSFRARMVNGWYAVTLYLGDAKAARYGVSTFAEGQLYDQSPATTLGQFVVRRFAVKLTDGMMNLRFASMGGAGTKFAMNALTILPTNAAAVAGADQAVNEGTLLQFAGQAAGPAPLAYHWDFGDGSVANGSLTPTKTYTDQGIFNVTLTVTDGQGLQWQDSMQVTVGNVAPAATFANNGPRNEGSTASVSFSGQQDPSALDTSAGFRYSYDFNNDGTFEITNSTATSANLPAALSADGPAARVVRGRITDKDGGFTDYTTTVTINNVAPTVNFSTSIANTTVTFTPSVSDPGNLDTFTYAWNFGDNTTSTQAAPVHAYAQSGLYSVVLAVTDKDGARTTKSADILIDGQLIHQNNLQYVGAFRLPSGTFGASSFDYGGTALAFNPANNSLFIVGHDWDQAVAEVAIPQSIVNSANLNNLSTASVLQNFVNVMGRVPNWTLEGTVKVGGLMVVNGQLIGTAYEFYDADTDAVRSHFKLNSLNLATAGVTGLFQVGNVGGGYVGGYMAEIPSEWQSALGASYVTGQAALPIIGRTSLGPAAFGFDPTSLAAGVNTGTPYVYYPLNHPNLGDMVGPAHPLFNGASEINGMFFAPETRSVVFFGSTGMTAVGYGEAVDFNDNNRTSKGYHAQNGVYSYYAWAYDVNDLIAVKNGTKQPWEITPYESWSFDVPQFEGAKHIGGVAFDAATGRLYVSQRGGDSQGGDYMPLIQVYQLNLD